MDTTKGQAMKITNIDELRNAIEDSGFEITGDDEGITFKSGNEFFYADIDADKNCSVANWVESNKFSTASGFLCELEKLKSKG